MVWRVVFCGWLCGVLSVGFACGPPAPPEVKGCASTKLYQKDPDYAKAGPWAVGAKTFSVDKLRVEVWYPAKWQSEKDQTSARYDVRLQLPEGEQTKIPDDKAPIQICNCYRDLPLDKERGPYPVVIFLHGTAGFRTQSLQHVTHWASRGFVVFAADHPGLMLGDLLQLKFGAKQADDAKAILAALRSPSGDMAFLQGAVDLERVAVSGHSAGGSALADLGKEAGIQVLIPMAAGGTKAGEALKSTLILGGDQDAIVPPKRQQDGYTSSPKTKRLVLLEKAGHLAFSDLCEVGKEQGGLIKLAREYKVKIPDGFDQLIETLATDGCKEGQLPAAQGWPIIHFASSAVLEETLHCDPTASTALQGLQTRYSAVKEYKEERL